MQETVNKIIMRHLELWGAAPTINKINAGFTNSLFCIADKFVLKVCHDKNNESEFACEIDFYIENESCVPKLFAYSKATPMYIVTEKIEGGTLYGVWHTLAERERENIVVQICEILQSLHCRKGSPFNWSKYIKEYYRRHLDALITRQQLSREEVELVSCAMDTFDFYLNGGNFVYIHNDLHFDNILYNDGNIKIIDYESSRYAPIDKELEIIYFMSQMPHKHASEENEKFVKIEDYLTLLPYFKKHYPLMFNIPHLEKRIAIYHLRDALEQYGDYPGNKELHERILKLAKYICAGRKKI